MVGTTADLPGKIISKVANSTKSKPPAVDSVELQRTVLRFADEISTAMIVGTDKLQRGTNKLEMGESLQWKTALDGALCSIASGPSPYADFLDLTVFVTVVRGSIEDSWQPRVFGESAQQLLESCREAETNLWHFADRVLTTNQTTELHLAINKWRLRNPEPESVLAARAGGFVAQMVEPAGNEAEKPGSVFNLLMLDPLAGVDPAVREIAQTRMFAERALFVAQKMPRLIRWQTELLSLNALQSPNVKQLVTNSTQLTESVQSFAKLADQLPRVVDEQRVAAIKQVLDGLAAERTNWVATVAADEMNLRPTLSELRQTLNAANELMKSSEATTKSIDAFIGRFDKGTNEPQKAPDLNSRPFDILEYATTAKELAVTIRELNTAVVSLDKAMPQIQKAGDVLESRGNSLLNRVFAYGAALITLLSVGLCVAAVLHRRPARTPDATRQIELDKFS